jgi:hypothetical protein
MIGEREFALPPARLDARAGVDWDTPLGILLEEPEELKEDE